MPRKMPDLERRKPTQAEKDAIEITLAWLEERCVQDEDTGCWVWHGFISKRGQPQCRITIEPKVSATMLVRRLVAKMMLDDIVSNVMQFLSVRQCGVQDGCLWGCCRPEHVEARTKTQAMRTIKGKPMPLSQKMAISKARRRNSKVSDEIINEMLTSNEKGSHLSIKLGLHPCYVPHVRTGRLRAYSAAGGMFTGLMATFHDQKETA